MADILPFPTPDTFYRDFARTLPERRTQDIIADLSMLPMLSEEFAIARNVLFAELAVKSEWIAQ